MKRGGASGSDLTCTRCRLSEERRRKVQELEKDLAVGGAVGSERGWRAGDGGIGSGRRGNVLQTSRKTLAGLRNVEKLKNEANAKVQKLSAEIAEMKQVRRRRRRGVRLGYGADHTSYPGRSARLKSFKRLKVKSETEQSIESCNRVNTNCPSPEIPSPGSWKLGGF